jgi:hypothetical protein
VGEDAFTAGEQSKIEDGRQDEFLNLKEQGSPFEHRTYEQFLALND